MLQLLGSFGRDHPLGTLAALLCLPVIYIACRALYNVLFHPLSRFPGPISHAISRIPYWYHHVNGTLPFYMLTLHKKYGNIVRIAPDELAFSDPRAWKDIMGHQQSGKEFGKAQWFYRPLESEPTHIINESRDVHSRLRRQLAHGFSEKSMRDQEPLITKYVDMLIHKLRENSGSGPVSLSDWYNFCTFDIIGDLAFGEAFGCLQESQYHTWIKGIFQAGRIGTVLQVLSSVPSLKRLLLSMMPKSARDAQEEHKKLTREKLMKRMNNGQERPDLIEGLLRKKEELNLGLESLIANGEILIIGGSETTATLLSGATFFLLTNPKVLQKLAEEVRTTFKSEDEISIVSVGKLTYMLACLNESLRMYPPIANGLPRIVPQGGAHVLDEFIPENAYVSIHQWALYRREEYFSDADHFHPERFLGDPKFESDIHDALQPFHVGPRNCLGRNLAYAEMRLILARVIYNFDMRLDESSVDWIKQKNFLMWQKGPLKVHMTPVKRY